MADRLISAIDIGSSKIATIVGIESKEHDEIRIIGFNSTPSRGVKKGLVVDIDKVTESVEESIEKVPASRVNREIGVLINHQEMCIFVNHVEIQTNFWFLSSCCAYDDFVAGKKVRRWFQST